jgi:iron(III) transport system ATP-binding protein
VRTPIGVIASPGSLSGTVEVMVRPEDLALSSEGGEPVVVVSHEYYGHDQMVTVRLHNGELVRVREIAGHDFAPGQRLGVRVRGDVMVYPGQ